MNKMLINATQRDELRVAITTNGLLIDLDLEHAEQQQRQSNIYKGIITSIEPHLDAVFINYGSEKHGFLPLKEISDEYFITSPSNDNSKSNIKKLLKEGQEVVVQVEKDERGTKGAALTTFISIAGSYLVLMPNRPNAGGVSRRIEGEEREQLKKIIDELNLSDGMSVIIRTAGVGRSNEELQWDLEVLLRYWEAIKQAAVAKPGPYLIHQESDVIIRAIRDHLRQDVDEIIIDEQSAYDRAHAYLSQIRPDFLDNLKLYSDHFPLFSRYQVEQQIENAYQHEVQLPSGGSIVIDHTEALVAIDINSARATKGGNIEETAFHTNKEAADEIARQMRIRDIGGLIVIDFIDMTSSAHQREVENILRNSLNMDRARLQVGRISRFGLLELSRQRIRSALVKITQNTCQSCSGRGSVRSVESLALSILHLIQEHAATTSSGQLQVQLPTDTATYILNEKRDMLHSIKEHSSLNVVIIPNTHMISPNYDLKMIPNPKQSSPASYKLVSMPKNEQPNKRGTKFQESKEPAINQFLSSPQKDKHFASSKKNHEGVIKRLWGFMFGTDEATKPITKAKTQQNRAPSKKRSGPPSKARANSGNKQHQKEGASRRGTRGGSRSGNTNKSPAEQQPAKQQPAKQQPAKQQPAKQQPAKHQPAKQQPAKQQPAKQQPAKQQPAKQQPAKQQPAKQQPAKQQPAKQQPAKQQPAAPSAQKNTNTPQKETKQTIDPSKLPTTTADKGNSNTTKPKPTGTTNTVTSASNRPTAQANTATQVTTKASSNVRQATQAEQKPAKNPQPEAKKEQATQTSPAEKVIAIPAKESKISRPESTSNLQQVKTKRNKPDSEPVNKNGDDNAN